MLSVSAHNVVGLGVAGVDERAIEDVAGDVSASAFHRFVNGMTQLWRQRNGVCFDAWGDRKLFNRDVFHLLFAKTVSQGEFDDGSLWSLVDDEVFVTTAVFGNLCELVIWNEHSSRRAFGWMLKTNGQVAVEIGARKGNPTVTGSFDFDIAENGKGWTRDDDLAQAGECGFKLRDGQCDGVHVVGVGLNAKSPCAG